MEEDKSLIEADNGQGIDAEMKPLVSYDDFAKLDIRVGRIVTAEKVEGLDKILKFEVDFGDHTRQILSGIAQFYTPEELTGKMFPFIINLEPKVIKGMESQGMILGTDDVEGRAVLFQPEKEVEPGARIK